MLVWLAMPTTLADNQNTVSTVRASDNYSNNLVYVRRMQPEAEQSIKPPSTRRVSSGQTASGKSTLTQEARTQVLQMVAEAGFDPQVAIKIITCESGWNPTNEHWNPPTATRPGSWDRGLWQINMTAHPEVTLACANDPICSTKFAIVLMQSKRGLNHWTCYSKSSN